MLLGLVLFYVGAVLILNGLWMLGRIGDREIWVINLFVGAVSLLAAFRQAFGADADAASVRAAALSLLFSLTYLWVAVNRFTGADGRGLGWFSLFVALTTVPVAVDALRGAWSAWDIWSGWPWAAWGLLWLLFFMQLVLRRPAHAFDRLDGYCARRLDGMAAGLSAADGQPALNLRVLPLQGDRRPAVDQHDAHCHRCQSGQQAGRHCFAQPQRAAQQREQRGEENKG